jgi:serine/threonine protein kinase
MNRLKNSAAKDTYKTKHCFPKFRSKHPSLHPYRKKKPCKIRNSGRISVNSADLLMEPNFTSAISIAIKENCELKVLSVENKVSKKVKTLWSLPYSILVSAIAKSVGVQERLIYQNIFGVVLPFGVHIPVLKGQPAQNTVIMSSIQGIGSLRRFNLPFSKFFCERDHSEPHNKILECYHCTPVPADKIARIRMQVMDQSTKGLLAGITRSSNYHSALLLTDEKFEKIIMVCMGFFLRFYKCVFVLRSLSLFNSAFNHFFCIRLAQRKAPKPVYWINPETAIRMLVRREADLRTHLYHPPASISSHSPSNTCDVINRSAFPRVREAASLVSMPITYINQDVSKEDVQAKPYSVQKYKNYWFKSVNGTDQSRLASLLKEIQFPDFLKMQLKRTFSDATLDDFAIPVKVLITKSRAGVLVPARLQSFGSFDRKLCMMARYKACKDLVRINTNLLELGAVHCDLKPENLFGLSRLRDEDSKMCIGDFGLSRTMAEFNRLECRAQLSLGTPGYQPIRLGLNYKESRREKTVHAIAFSNCQIFLTCLAIITQIPLGQLVCCTVCQKVHSSFPSNLYVFYANKILLAHGDIHDDYFKVSSVFIDYLRVASNKRSFCGAKRESQRTKAKRLKYYATFEAAYEQAKAMTEVESLFDRLLCDIQIGFDIDVEGVRGAELGLCVIDSDKSFISASAYEIHVRRFIRAFFIHNALPGCLLLCMKCRFPHVYEDFREGFPRFHYNGQSGTLSVGKSLSTYIVQYGPSLSCKRWKVRHPSKAKYSTAKQPFDVDYAKLHKYWTVRRYIRS